MDRHSLTQNIVVFTHPGGHSSCGMILTQNGIVLIDTTARSVDILKCLDKEGITTKDICYILLTHSHSDHTSGIPLFNCPVLASKLTAQRIKKRGTDRSKKQIPTNTFEGMKSLIISGENIEIIHVGGHTPGSSIVWPPQKKILFARDLIFANIYPFLVTADIPKLMEVLRWLPTLEAKFIVPGHGEICENQEAIRQLDYIETTWGITKNHLLLGHTIEQTLVDPTYPVYSERGYENLHSWNIKVCYQQLNKLRSTI